MKVFCFLLCYSTVLNIQKTFIVNVNNSTSIYIPCNSKCSEVQINYYYKNDNGLNISNNSKSIIFNNNLINNQFTMNFTDQEITLQYQSIIFCFFEINATNISIKISFTNFKPSNECFTPSIIFQSNLIVKLKNCTFSDFIIIASTFFSIFSQFHLTNLVFTRNYIKNSILVQLKTRSNNQSNKNFIEFLNISKNNLTNSKGLELLYEQNIREDYFSNIFFISNNFISAIPLVLSNSYSAQQKIEADVNLYNIYFTANFFINAYVDQVNKIGASILSTEISDSGLKEPGRLIQILGKLRILLKNIQISENYFAPFYLTIFIDTNYLTTIRGLFILNNQFDNLVTYGIYTVSQNILSISDVNFTFLNRRQTKFLTMLQTFKTLIKMNIFLDLKITQNMTEVINSSFEIFFTQFDMYWKLNNPFVLLYSNDLYFLSMSNVYLQENQTTAMIIQTIQFQNPLNATFINIRNTRIQNSSYSDIVQFYIIGFYKSILMQEVYFDNLQLVEFSLIKLESNIDFQEKYEYSLQIYNLSILSILNINVNIYQILKQHM